MPHFLGIIPSRYASSRFPGKPLAMIAGKPMIQWVYERASAHFDHLLVATDDRRIMEAVGHFGGTVLMTSRTHRSGTERCAEALRLYQEREKLTFSHVVNIQGDEPLIMKEQLQELTGCMDSPEAEIATLIRPLQEEDAADPNTVKVVVDLQFRALYFSRAVIPFRRGEVPFSGPGSRPSYGHVGIYAYRCDVLQKIAALPPSPLEMMESLEQLRWLEHGISIRTRITGYPSRGVDTPEDLEKIRKMF